MDLTAFLHGCFDDETFLDYIINENFLYVPQIPKFNGVMRPKPNKVRILVSWQTK